MLLEHDAFVGNGGCQRTLFYDLLGTSLNALLHDNDMNQANPESRLNLLRLLIDRSN
jgi:hypothetical protein